MRQEKQRLAKEAKTRQREEKKRAKERAKRLKAGLDPEDDEADIEKGDDATEKDTNTDTEKPAEKEPFALYNVDLRIPRGAFVALVGRVGSGKSSLLQALAGGAPPPLLVVCPLTAWAQRCGARRAR